MNNDNQYKALLKAVGKVKELDCPNCEKDGMVIAGYDKDLKMATFTTRGFCSQCENLILLLTQLQ